MGLEELAALTSLCLVRISSFVIGGSALIPEKSVDGKSFIKYAKGLVFRTINGSVRGCFNACKYVTEHKDNFVGYIREEKFWAFLFISGYLKYIFFITPSKNSQL